MPHAPAPPDVTWLLPVRNGEPYLLATLQSIAAQTYPLDRQHVLAWDNGSTDGSVSLLRHWIGPGRPIPGQVVADRPLPLGLALAEMVRLAPSERCARIDADDINEPHRLEQQARALAADDRLVAVGSGMTLIGPAGEARGQVMPPFLRDADLRWALRFGNVLNHPTMLFRRSAVLQAGNYRDRTPGQDYDLWIRLARVGRLANLPDPLVRYRIHGASVTATRGNDPRRTSREVIREHLAQLWPGLDADAVERLRDLLDDRDRLDVTARDLLRLLATALGDPAAASVLRSPRFREQVSSLATRLAKVPAQRLGVWRMVKALRSAA